MRARPWLGWVLALSVPTGAGAIPILTVDTDPSLVGIQPSRSVLLGAEFEVEIRVSGIESLAPLHAYEFDLVSNPAVIGSAALLPQGFFAPDSFVLEQDAAPPDVNFAETRTVEEGVVAEGALLRVRYAALALGTSPLDLENVILSAPRGVPIAPFDLAPGSITVVPEPGSAGLLGCAVTALAWLRARSATPRR